MFLKNILKTKKASVWGTGYLGYTTMLKLQNSGFYISAYDLYLRQFSLFLKGKYPSKEQMASWSLTDYLPELNYQKVMGVNTPKEMFRGSLLHIIAVPEPHKNIAKDNMMTVLAKIFAENLKNSRSTPLIIFEPVFTPGHIERYFVDYLRSKGIHCSRDYYLGVLLRTDWSVESFLSQKNNMLMAGYCPKSSAFMRELFGYLDIQTIELSNLKEAEIYINSFNAIQAMVSDFTRQLALGYPAVNVKRISELLFKNVTFDDCVLNIGTGGAKMTFAIEHLINGSDYPENLTLLKEFQDISISSVLSYAEYLIRRAYKSVAILGITYKGNQKDLTLSPAITLADYLVKNAVKVSLSDPFCSKKEINKLVKGAKAVEFPDGVFSSDVLVVAADHNKYRYLSQSCLDKIKKHTKLIIDNYGIWSELSFGKSIKYHRVGDGTLDLLR